jgi:tRNA A37 methylthiotransferase MiaB
VASDRIALLSRRADEHGLAFRQQLVGEVVELLVEHQRDDAESRHGRCERYFDVHFDDGRARPGDLVRVRVDRVTPRRTYGTVLAGCVAAAEGAA